MYTKRLFFVENLRGFLTILILAMSSMLAYMQGASSNYTNYIITMTPVLDDNRIAFFDGAHEFLDLFVMQLIFFLSGFFSFMSYLKKNCSLYLIDRFAKLAIPFLLGVTTLIPLAFYPAYLLAGNSDSFAYFWVHEYFQSYWNPGPLWFLWQLFLFDLFFGITLKFFPKLYMGITEKLGEYSEYKVMLCILFTCVVVYVISYFIWPSRNIDSWINLYGPFWLQKNRFFLYFTLFMSGVMVGGSPVLREKLLSKTSHLCELWKYWLLMGIAWFVALKLIEHSNYSMATAADENYLHNIVSSILQVFVALNIMIALLAIFIQFFNDEIKYLTKLGSVAFTIYVLHFPMVTLTQYFLTEYNLTAMLKFILVFSISLSISTILSLMIKKLPTIKLI